MFYRPPRTLGLSVGGVLTLWATIVGIVLLLVGVRSELGFVGLLAYLGAGVALLLAGLFAFWSYSLATLSYALDRNGLVITWGPTQQVIPLGAIERLVPGTAIGVPRVRGVTWWGCHVGRATIERIGAVLFYSTGTDPRAGALRDDAGARLRGDGRRPGGLRAAGGAPPGAGGRRPS